MKKVIGLIAVIIAIGSIALNVYNERKKDTSLALLNTKLSFYKENKVKANVGDNLEQHLNNVLILKEKLDNLTYKKLNVNDLQNIDNTLSTLNENLKINMDILEKDISALINTYSKDEQELIKNIYNENPIIKNKETYKEKLTSYQTNIKNDIVLLNYLTTNKDKYYFKDNALVYKTNELKRIIEANKTDIIVKEESVVNIPILMYHGVLDEAYGAVELFVRVSEFESQMKYLHDNNFTPIFLSEIENASKYDKPILITFDDGYKDVYTNAFPILKKYNLKSNLYIITDWVGGEVYVNWDDIKVLDQSSIMEIGSHTRTHKNLGTLKESAVEYELKGSKEILEKNLNKKINTVAYPYGGHNKMVMEVAKKYYDYALSTNSGKEVSNNLNKYELNRYYIYRGMSLSTFKSYIN